MIQSAGIIGAGRAGSALAVSLAQTVCRLEFLVDPAPAGVLTEFSVYTALSDVSQTVDLLVVCVAGWIPSHAVNIIDVFHADI